jgi:hypothetical protein
MKTFYRLYSKIRIVLSRSTIISLILSLKTKEGKICAPRIRKQSLAPSAHHEPPKNIKIVDNYKSTIITDIEEVSLLYKAFVGSFPLGENRYAPEHTKEEFFRAAFSGKYIYFVAMDKISKPVGFIAMTNDTTFLKKDAWLDIEYFNKIFHNDLEENSIRKYWVTSMCVDKKHRNKHLGKDLVSAMLIYCYNNKLSIFYDWLVEDNPYLVEYIKSVGREMGLPLNSCNISANISSALWLKEYPE